MQSAPKPCGQCGVLVFDGTGRCQAHKHVARFGDIRRGSRQSRGYGAEWGRTRLRILTRDGGICQHCLPASVHIGTEVDHKIPRAQGGSESDDNLQTICTAAHRAKTQREAAWARAQGIVDDPGRRAAGGGGGESLAAGRIRTGRFAIFPCAQVSGEGGVAGQAGIPAPAGLGASRAGITVSPGVGPMGDGQPADAGPATKRAA